MKQRGTSYPGLPIKRIDALLGIRLISPRVHLSRKGRYHIIKKHPEMVDFIEHLDSLIACPSYVGRAPKQTRSFEIISNYETSHVLVAIEITADRNGEHHILSMYEVSRNTVNRRLRKQHLFSLNADE